MTEQLTTLDEYLSKNGITEEKFGTQIKCVQSAVHKMRKGHMMPSLRRALKIKQVTNGEVIPESFAKSKPRGKGLRS